MFCVSMGREAVALPSHFIYYLFLMETVKPRTGKIVGWSILGVVVLLIIWTISAYNSLVRMREDVKTQLSNVEVQYQRRFDLIPNYVESVKGIFEQERSVFNAIAEARTRYSGSTPGTPDRVNAINEVESAFARLLVIVENYPTLKSSENVAKLQDELAGTENRIAVERRRYNESVNVYEKATKVFPKSIVAGAFNFESFPRFDASEEASVAPKVDLEVK